MRKRLLCMLLAACVVLSLVPSIALPSNAAMNMKTSERAIAILKSMEGFLEKPVYDNGQYSVGYGSGCNPEDYPNGITEEEADVLMRKYLAAMEVTVNSFADKYDIYFTQYQFDALMLFTYNCGGNWVHSDGMLRDAIIQGKTGNQFIFPMSLWSSSSAQVNMGLVERRLVEANLYLNGEYAYVSPSNYTYVLFDHNEGVSDIKVQGYDCNLSSCVQAVPTRTGYRFLGWYTAKEGGAWVTELTSANAEQTLYAHWQADKATVADAVAVSYQVAASELKALSFYDAPGGKTAGSLNENTLVTVVADYVDGSNVKWGKMVNDSWVCLGDPRTGTYVQTEEKEEEPAGVEVTVTGDFVNVRSGPGTTYKVVAMVTKGDKIRITQTGMVGNTLWGKFRAGWLSLEFTDYQGGLTPSDTQLPGTEDPEETPIATGVVTASRLNIRSAAGTHGYMMGCYQKGDKVEIFEKSVVGNTTWGRTDKGWISLTYVKLDEPVTEEPTTPPTEPEETKPEEDNTDEKDPEGIYGTVTSKNGLNIRSAPGTNSPSVGTYRANTRIKILEQRLANGVIWGRTDKGWVSMNYVKLDAAIGGDLESNVYGVVTAGTLCIRKGPGTGYAMTGSLSKGDRIAILEMTKNGATSWGRTEKGWVCMTYVKLEEDAADVPATQPPATEPEEGDTVAPPAATKVMGKVTANGGLNIRSAASTKSTVVGAYHKGDSVVILEQKLVNGTAWGRTDKGWICMNYVKLDVNNSGASTAGYTGTVSASALCIRKGPGTGNVIVGSYRKGQVITILETTKVGNTTWGRTDLGWVCMDYVK